MTTAQRRLTEPCPATDNGRPCPRNKSTEYLMCRAHWSKVPRELQAAVYATFRGYTRGSATLGELRAVQVEAVASAST